MTNPSRFLKCIILLSALSYSVAFFVPDLLGFLIIPALVLLLYVFLHLPASMYHTTSLGLLWGMVVYGLHFFWLVELLLTKSEAGKFFSCLFYCFFVFYFSCTSALWFLCTYILCSNEKNIRLLLVVSSIMGYFLFITNFSLWFLGLGEGYPFISPLIPLTRYSIFLSFVYFCTTLFASPKKLDIPLKTIFIKPTRYKDHALKAGYELFHRLDQSLENNKKQTEELVYVAPESAYPYSLNKEKSILKLWSHILPAKSNLFIGTHHEETPNKIYQAVYWIDSCHIKNYYVKQKTVPFVETIPNYFTKYLMFKKIFLKNSQGFAERIEPTIFYFSKKIIIIPQICSEFFFNFSEKNFRLIKKNNQEANIIIFLFINDSWFVDYFKKIMENVTYLKASTFRLPILLINHTGCKKIIPS